SASATWRCRPGLDRRSQRSITPCRRSRTAVTVSARCRASPSPRSGCVRSRRHGSESSTRPEGSVSADPAPPSGAAARRYLPVALAVGAVWGLLDQLSKWWAERELTGGHTIDVVWTLRLRLVTNTGASFSLGEGLGPV